MSKVFNAVSSSCALSRDGTLVRLTIEVEDDEPLVLIFARRNLPALAAQIQSHIAPGSIAPIQPSHLRAGQNIHVETYQIARHPQGAKLTLFCNLGDAGEQRGVGIPLVVDREEAEDLAHTILRFLSSDPA